MKWFLLAFTIIILQSNNVINEAFQPILNHVHKTTTASIDSKFSTVLNAKKRKNEKPEDIFNNHWYDEVDSKATPDDVFWEEMDRQKTAAGIVPENLDDPLSALPGAGAAAAAGGGGGGASKGSKWTVIDGSMGKSSKSSMIGEGGTIGMGLGGVRGSASPLPQRTLTEEKTTDAVLASFSAHMVDDNWLDEEYIERMKMMEEESEMDREEQDLLLQRQIEEWENEEEEEDDDDEEEDDDELFNVELDSRSNEPWDYYRPDGATSEDDNELEEDEDQGKIKIDLEKGKN